MSKIIGVSGPQGGGKSTMLSGLKERGFYVDDFKVSRTVQTRLGWTTLENAYSSAETMMKFQDMILQVKEERELHNLSLSVADLGDSTVIVTERTFADIGAYAALWAGKLIQAGKWDPFEMVEYMRPFWRRCRELQFLYSGVLVLPYMEHIAWQSDPNRAKQEDLNGFKWRLERFLEDHDVPFYTMTETGIEERIFEAQQWIEEITL